MVSPNTWKYSTLGLLAILVVGLSLPQASAHITNSTAHMLQHIYNFVDGIEARTNNLPDDPADQSLIDTRLDDIETSLSNLSPGASPKTVQFEFEVDPPNSNPSSSFIEILPRVEGMSYSGHLSMQQIVTAGNNVAILCDTDDDATRGIILSADSGPGALDFMNEDFTCYRMQIQFGEAIDGVDSGPISVWGLAQYFESHDVDSISN